jgi:zinc/manganese transport system substrate-binding protein
MCDIHPAGNPHYLFNPYNTFKVTELIANRLIELDPDNKEDYLKNLENFNDKLKAKIEEFEDTFSIFTDIELVCYHNHWSYLLDWLNIKSVGYIELRPGIPPTPRHKMEIINLMKEKEIKVVIISSWKEPTKAEEVAEAVNAQLIVLPGEVNAMDNTDNYFEWMGYIVDKLSNAFCAYVTEDEKQKRLRKRSRGKK